MQKGKFGFYLWLYPFISLWTILTGSPLGCLLIAGFVIAVEQDEWTIKQCLQALMFSFYWSIYDVAMGYAKQIPVAGFIFSIIDFIVWLVLIILVMVIGLSRLKKGREIGLPGKGTVNRAYGYIQQYIQQPQPQYQQPVQQPFTAPPAQMPYNKGFVPPAAPASNGFTPPAPPAAASANNGFTPPPAPAANNGFTPPPTPQAYSSFTPPPQPPASSGFNPPPAPPAN